MNKQQLHQRLIEVAARSTSKKKKVGALTATDTVVDGHVDYTVISVGWNYNTENAAGPCEHPDGATKEHVIHAEIDCLNGFARYAPVGTDYRAVTMYITHEPCTGCQAALHTYGIRWTRVKFTAEQEERMNKGSNGIAKVDPTLYTGNSGVTMRGGNGPVSISDGHEGGGTGQASSEADVHTLAQTLKERGSVYGTFAGNSKCTQGIMRILEKTAEEAGRQLEDYELEAFHMIAHKMSRVANGKKKKKDNWHDIAGYAKLAEDMTKDD